MIVFAYLVVLVGIVWWMILSVSTVTTDSTEPTKYPNYKVEIFMLWLHATFYALVGLALARIFLEG